MRGFIVAAALFAGLTLAQDLSAIQGLPDCGKTCINNMLQLAPSLGCPNNNITCLCSNMDFGNGVRDCSFQSCPADVDKSSIIAVGNSFCADALSAASGASGTVATVTATDASVTTTVVASSDTAAPASSALAGVGAAGVITTTDTAGSTYTTSAPLTSAGAGGLAGTNGTIGGASASGGTGIGGTGISATGTGGMTNASTLSGMSGMTTRSASNSGSASASSSSGGSSTAASGSEAAGGTTPSSTSSGSGAERTAVAGFVGFAESLCPPTTVSRSSALMPSSNSSSPRSNPARLPSLVRLYLPPAPGAPAALSISSDSFCTMFDIAPVAAGGSDDAGKAETNILKKIINSKGTIVWPAQAGEFTAAGAASVEKGRKTYEKCHQTHPPPTDPYGHEEGDEVLQVPSGGSNSANGSRSSRHSHKAQLPSMDLGHEAPENLGLSMTAGVITSIPYDSVPADQKSPITVDYLPKNDPQSAKRRDPLPHHLNKGGGDFHQYPAWDPQSAPVSNGSNSHLSGPRPPPHSSSASSLKPLTAILPARDSSRKPVPPYILDAQNGPTDSHGTLNSISTGDSASNHRNSFDQMSVMSSVSSATRGSSIFSSDNSSRTAVHERPNTSSRGSHYPSSFAPSQPAGFSSTASFNPDGPHFPRPNDDRIVEQQFVDMMNKRNFQGMPEQAKRQMLAYPASKKWQMVHQDKVMEWQGEQKRRQAARNTILSIDGSSGMIARVDEEGSPEWYVKRVMNDTITAKQLGSLSVSLRTQPISWVKAFVEAQGQVALTNVLAKINRRQGQGPAPASGSTNDRDLDREYDIIKCLKALMNNKYGADDALAHQQVVVSLATSLISPRLTTRKLVSEVLTFLCHWAEGEGHLKVLQAMDQVKNHQGENGRFDAWMRIVEVTIDGRGKMGSLVGASDELRSGGIGMENLLMEYAVTTLFLLNMMIDAPEHDLQLRCHIRAQFTSCGIKRILHKMEDFQYEVIDKQIERYRENEAIDYEDLLQRENSSMKDSIEGEVKDLQDPTQVVEAIMSKVQGSRAQDYFMSAMQHMLLIRDNDGEDRLRMFQLVDAMLSYVAMDRRLPDMDLKQSLNFSVQSLLDRLHTDSEARQALDETTEARQVADSAIAERDEMKARIDMGADGLVAKLQKQLEEQAQIIELQGRQNDALKAELADLQRIRTQEQQRNELETRELYLMLRDAQDFAASVAKKGVPDALASTDPKKMQGILDRETLMARLETQLERAKTQCKLEGKVWQQAGPSDRLRELREQMDGGEEEGQSESFADKVTREFGSGPLAMTSRSKMLKGPRRAAADALARDSGSTDASYKIEGDGDDAVIYEKPRIVEMKRPQMSARQATGLLGEIAAKVRRYDASEDEEGDGITTGPSHPSLESDSPKTP
ncbi:MAG: hypothetical protein Q9217_005383, partial [Psora testacea]